MECTRMCELTNGRGKEESGAWCLLVGSEKVRLDARGLVRGVTASSRGSSVVQGGPRSRTWFPLDGGFPVLLALRSILARIRSICVGLTRLYYSMYTLLLDVLLTDSSDVVNVSKTMPIEIPISCRPFCRLCKNRSQGPRGS